MYGFCGAGERGDAGYTAISFHAHFCILNKQKELSNLSKSCHPHARPYATIKTNEDTNGKYFENERELKRLLQCIMIAINILMCGVPYRFEVNGLTGWQWRWKAKILVGRASQRFHFPVYLCFDFILSKNVTRSDGPRTAQI